MKIKRLTALLCLLGLLLGLWGCGKKENTETENLAGGDFTIAVTEAPDSLNPFVAESDTAREMFLLVYDPLWRIDSGFQPVNCLVDSYDISSDGLTWTIRLRRDVSFSDGEALTSADVKFSYELFAQYGQNAAATYEGITAIQCPDDWTVIITTDSVKGDMLYSQTPILPKHLWSAYEDEPEQMDNSAMIGSGPFIYQLPELEPGQEQSEWSLTSRGDYFAGSARLSSVSYQLYETESMAANALADGLVDACMDLTETQLYSLSSQYGVESYVVQGPMQGSCQLLLNTGEEALLPEAVREAIMYAIDWDSIYSVGFGAAGEQGNAVLPPESPYYLEQERKYFFDTNRALTLLTAAGFADGDGDGVLESLDNTLELSFQLLSAEEDVWAAAAGSILTRELSEIGIEIDWVTGSAEEIKSRCTKGGSWDMCLVSEKGSCDPQDIMRNHALGNSVTGWESEEYDGLYNRLCTCLDAGEKTAILSELQNLLVDSNVCAVLGYGTAVQAIRADRWMGYAAAAEEQNGLFGTGCIEVYMQLCPYVEGVDTTEETGSETESETLCESETAVYTLPTEKSGEEPAPMATAVPLE